MDFTFHGARQIALEEACVLVAYPDGEHLSIGYGHNDPTLTPTSKITFEEAYKLLLDDLPAYAKTVTNLLKGAHISSWEFDALGSCYYNKGMYRRKDKTSVFQEVCDLVRSGDRLDAMALFCTINRDSHWEFKPGLVKRRTREMDVFFTGQYAPDTAQVKLYPHGIHEPYTWFKFPKELAA